MATVKIKEVFVDRHTSEKYAVGQIVDFTDERISEIREVLPDALEIVGEEPKRGRKKVVKDEL